MNNLWRVLAIAGTVGGASALALATEPVKQPAKPVPVKEFQAKTPAKALPAASNDVAATLGSAELPPLRGLGNDFCANATVLGCDSTVTADNSFATVDGNDFWTCRWSGGVGTGSIWYKFTATHDTATLQTCNSFAPATDSIIEVLAGTCGSFVSIGCSEDACGLLSRVDLTGLTVGQEYYVQVSSWSGVAPQGAYTLELRCTPPEPPINDECDGAISLGCNSSVIANNEFATIGFSDFSSCRFGGGVGAGSIWYKFTATDTSARVQTCASTGAANDSLLEVFGGACGGLFSLGCNDDFCGLLSRVDVEGLTVGQEYYVQVSSWNATIAQGAYTLELICPLPPIPPGGNCATAFDLAIPGSVFGSTVGFEPNANIPACGAGSGTAPSVWYAVNGTGGVIEATLCNGTSYDSALAIFTGDCDFLTCVRNNDDACGLQSRTTFLSTPGQTYYIVVRGYAANAGSYTLDVSDLGPPPPGDFCADAIAFGPVPGSVSGDTSPFTADGALGCGNLGNSPSIWYSVVGTGNSFRASLCNGTAYDSSIAAYSGDCAFLNCLASNDDACGLQSSIIFPTVAGQTVFVQVGGFAANSGFYNLEISELLPPPNDDCAAAITLNCNTSVIADNSGATDGFDDLYSCRVGGGVGNNSMWYKFVATEDSARIQACNSTQANDSYIEVFSGACGFMSTVGCNDDGCNGFLSRVDVTGLTVGQEYYVMFASWNTAAAGVYDLDLMCPAPPPCDLMIPGNAVAEGETGCFDTNGGCNSPTPIFGAINCGVPIHGTVYFDGGTRDTDWFQFTVTTAAEYTFTVNSRFESLIGFVGTNTPNPTGACGEMTGSVSPAAFGAGECDTVFVTAFLQPGVWTAFVAPVFGNTIVCESPDSEYVATLSSADCGTPTCPVDWNQDGSVNSGDISSFLTAWIASVQAPNLVADFNNDGVTNSGDISAFLSAWITAVQTGNC